LQVAEAAKPVPKTNELLVKVRYATVTRGDVNLRNGANAEYTPVPEKPKQGVITRKPEGMTFKDAAAQRTSSWFDQSARII
jgi:NADPH:quinone reductase-like Zn-dependent oxidoreductase